MTPVAQHNLEQGYLGSLLPRHIPPRRHARHCALVGLLLLLSAKQCYEIEAVSDKCPIVSILCQCHIAETVLTHTKLCYAHREKSPPHTRTERVQRKAGTAGPAPKQCVFTVLNVTGYRAAYLGTESGDGCSGSFSRKCQQIQP